MTTSGKENFRLKSYKNKSLNPDEMRRRREEEGLQLRKQKREEQVLCYSCDNCNQSLHSLVLHCLWLFASLKPFLSCSCPAKFIHSQSEMSHLQNLLPLLQALQNLRLSAPHSLKCKIGRSSLKMI